MSDGPDDVRPTVVLEQVERYRFEASFPGTTVPPVTLDEPAPTGSGRGPSPVEDLAFAVGHCLSTTFASTLERSRVPVGRIRTAVWTTLARNANGRLRVVSLRARIESAPIDPADREKFGHAVEIFEDYCPVTGAVRQGIPTTVEVRAPPTAPAV